MKSLTTLRPAPRLIPPDWLPTPNVAATFTATSQRLAGERRQAAGALMATRQSIREGNPPPSLSGALSAATDALGLAVAAELKHVRTWHDACASMEAEIKGRAAALATEITAADAAARETFATKSGVPAALQAQFIGTWMQGEAPAAVKVRELRALARTVAESMDSVQMDGRIRRWHDEGGPEVIKGLEAALAMLAGTD